MVMLITLAIHLLLDGFNFDAIGNSSEAVVFRSPLWCHAKLHSHQRNVYISSTDEISYVSYVLYVSYGDIHHFW